MKKVILFISSVVLLLGIVNPQSVIAQNKIKKVKYMNHKFNGEVNSDKIPDGEGELDLMGIKGYFEGNKVFNATIDGGKIKYNGDLTFDESNNVTLKAGGTFTYYYYIDSSDISWEAQVASGRGKFSVSEELQSDKVVSVSDFNITEAEINIPLKLEDVDEKLNPPTLKQARLIKEKVFQQTSYQTGTRREYVFVLEGIDNGINIHGAKDEQGRVWNYIRRKNTNSTGFSYSYRVTYSDGSYYSESVEPGKLISNWEVYLSDNVVIKGTSGNSSKSSVCVATENEIVKTTNSRIKSDINGFLEFYNSKKRPNDEDIVVKFINRDIQSLSDKEVEQIINKEILPSYGATNVYVVSDIEDDYWKNRIGKFEEGHYVSENTIIAKSVAEEAAKEKAARPSLNKKYGKINVDAIEKGNLRVGMPLNLLIDSELAYIRQGISVYKMRVYNNGERGEFKVEIAVAGKTHTGGAGIYYRMYRVWVNDKKITQFKEWNKADEREFNLLIRR